jgi:hypothetical protein
MSPGEYLLTDTIVIGFEDDWLAANNGSDGRIKSSIALKAIIPPPGAKIIPVPAGPIVLNERFTGVPPVFTIIVKTRSGSFFSSEVETEFSVTVVSA